MSELRMQPNLSKISIVLPMDLRTSSGIAGRKAVELMFSVGHIPVLSNSLIQRILDANQLHPLETVLSSIAAIIFVPLLLQTRGLSRRLTTFLLHFLSLLVSMVLSLDPTQQRRLAEEIQHIPRTADHLYRTLHLDSPYLGYVCCPRCFFLYDIKTWQPIASPIDPTPRGEIPPPPPPIVCDGSESFNLPIPKFVLSAPRSS